MFIGLGLVAAGLALVFKPQSSLEVEIIPAESDNQMQEVLVDIEGAVVSPGVYRLSAGSRINDLLISCQGLSEDADREWVAKNLNKAALLIDGAKIYIPQKGESTSAVAGSKTERGLVNINQADAVLLETLPGIGPSFAKKIVDYRKINGGYKSLEELMAVSGIGKSLYSQVKDLITIY